MATLYLVSLSYNYIENYRKSIKYLEILKNEFPKNSNLPEIYFLLGISFKEIKEKDKAKKCFKFIIENYPKNKLFSDSQEEYNLLKK